MKKIAILLASLIGLAGLTASAQQPASSYNVTMDFTYTSNYVFRGIEAADDAFTPSVELSVADFYIGLWTMQPINRDKGGFDAWQNEIDFYAGYSAKLTNTLSLEAVATYYWYPQAEGNIDDGYATTKTYEAGLGLTYANRGMTASVYGYYDFRLEASTVVASVGYRFPIPQIGTSIDVDFYVGSVSARDVAPDSPFKEKEAYNYYGFDINLPYHLTEKATLTAGLHYADNDGTPVGTPDNKLWFTLGLSVGF